jgi:predicted nucleic acid-binding protein
MRIYFDSCIVIYRIEQREPWAQRVNSLLAGPDAATHVFVTTELTRLECRVRPLALGLVDVLREYDAYFEQPALLWQGCDRPVFDLAARLRAQHGLKTPDALHLAAALTAGCEEFWTNDHRLDAAATSSLRVVVPADRP